MNLKKKITFLLLTCIGVCCLAQNSDSYFHELHLDGGRFNKKTNTIYEDHLGYLWLGTDSGLYRYDGHALMENQYDVFDENSIPNNSINSIIEDDFGNLWIGSESYLIWYNRKTNHFKGFYKNNTSTILGKSKEGTIWANLRNTGIVKIIPKNDFENIEFQTQLNYQQGNKIWTNDKRINDYVEDLFGRNWFATPKGILVLNTKNELVQTGFSKNTSLLINATNNTFIATTDEGVFLLEYKKGGFELNTIKKMEGFINDKTKPEFTSISTDLESGTTWISSQVSLYQGLQTKNSYDFNFTRVEQNSNNGTYENRINASIIDQYNNLWVATNKGVKKYIDRNSIFEYTSIDNNLSNRFTKSLLHEKDGDLFLTFDRKGLYKYNLKSKEKTLLATSIGLHSIIKKDFLGGELLFGSGKNLLISKNYNSKRKKVQFDTLKRFQYNIQDLIAISPHEIWVGLWSGGIRILTKDDNLSNFKNKVTSILFGKNVSVLHLDSKQNIWIGTRGDGLYKINLINEDIKVFNASLNHGLSSNAILCLLEDSIGNIWIGTRGGGLNFYNAKNQIFKNYGKNEGLGSTTIASIVKDNSQNLWVSTRDGISRFEIEEEKFVNFEIEDGVTESHFIFNSYAFDENGKIYFGCPGGFFTVNPENYKKALLASNTVITSYSIFRDFKESSTLENSKKHHEINEDIELAHHENNIAFEFSTLDFTAPNKNEFAYKLEGINDFWHHSKASNRNANYNDLPPGYYTFKVKSTNSHGHWNENPATFNFNISPPLWKSNLAYLIYTLLFISSIYFTWLLINRWFKLKKKLVAETVSREKDNEINRMKMVFFTDISHELRTPLALILGTIEKVVKEKKFTLSPFTSQRIYNNTLRMHRLINQLMDIRKFDEGKLKLQISKNNIVKDVEIIKSAFDDFAKIYDINYKFKTDQQSIIGWYDVDILEKILFNLLSNAFKYTDKKGTITVSLGQTTAKEKSFWNKQNKPGQYIKCCVQDNGLGIPKKDLEKIFDRYYQATKKHSNQIPGTGIGMELVQKLIERHHGSIHVISEENTFTEFTFYLPINKNQYHKKERINSGKPLTKNFIKNSEYQVIEEMFSEFTSSTKDIKNSKPLILLVEDNVELRSMVKEELNDDFEVIEASNGKEGYDMIIEKRPDLIICDILMPIEDGISLLRKLKNNTETKTLPIFMLTAKNSEETKIECLSLGADDFIEKPFSLEFVKLKVNNTFNSRDDLKIKYRKIISPEPTELKIDSNDEKFIRKLVTITEKHIGDSYLNVEFMAAEIGMSRANLYRKLQAINNDTPVNFIKQIRLKRAAQLLRANKMYVSEVAYLVGFSNQKYFSKCFNKEYGMSPTVYAKQALNKVDEIKTTTF